MKVVQLVMARQFRGAEIFAAQLSRDLMLNGVEVLYIALYKNTRPPQLVPSGIKCIDLDMTQTGWLNWALLKKLEQALHNFNPHIVQANAGDTLKYAWLVKKIFRLRYKIIFRNASTVSLYIKSPVQRWVYRIIYQSVDYVLSVSQYSKDDFVRTFPTVNNKIEVIPNSIRVDEPTTRILAFSPGDFNILHVAGFTFEKNHTGLLRIFERVKKKIPSARLWLVGEGPLRTHIEKQAEQMELHDVVFVGSVTNPRDYMMSAHVLVLPSVIEGLPGVILEAMVCKLPVVAYAVGGIGEVVKTGETGWLVARDDEDGMVTAIEKVMTGSFSEIIKNAFQLVTRAYDNQQIAQRFLEVYRKVVI
jgi:glycosyltransferase involved in cell wall biosynthesis